MVRVAKAETFTWRNTTSHFNAATSWDNQTLLGVNRVPTSGDFANLSGVGNVDPVVTNTASASAA